MNNITSIPPVIPPSLPRDSLERFLRWVGCAVLVGLIFLAVAVYGVTSYFRLGSEMAGLRDSLQSASGQEWHRQIALNVGGVTFGAVRAGLSLVKIEAEPRVALESIRGCEVGIYQTLSDTGNANRAAMLIAADKAMERRGWERIVGVIDKENLVAVYVPSKLNSTSRMKCAVMVCEDRQMILASMRANLDPAIEFALSQSEFGEVRKFLSQKPKVRLASF